MCEFSILHWELYELTCLSTEQMFLWHEEHLSTHVCAVPRLLTTLDKQLKHQISPDNVRRDVVFFYDRAALSLRVCNRSYVLTSPLHYTVFLHLQRNFVCWADLIKNVPDFILNVSVFDISTDCIYINSHVMMHVIVSIVTTPHLDMTNINGCSPVSAVSIQCLGFHQRKALWTEDFASQQHDKRHCFVVLTSKNEASKKMIILWL